MLSGNRNFEGRINSEVRANYLMSPPLVVAFALAGRIDIDLRKDAIGKGKDGQPVYLADLWPIAARGRRDHGEVDHLRHVRQVYAEVFAATNAGAACRSPRAKPTPGTMIPPTSAALRTSTSMTVKPAPVQEIKDARVLAVLGDSVTTDHISPAGSIKKDSPAGKYLQEHGVKPADFNSYGSRRGNHEVMVRGTFANVRLRNKMVTSKADSPAIFPTNTEMSIFDASEKYREGRTPLVILAGKEYGSGSSRDWAAKGPRLLGVRAVIAESYERIHRSNLVGMGVLPLQFPAGENAESLKPDRRRSLRDHRHPRAGRKIRRRTRGKSPRHVKRPDRNRIQSAGPHRHAAGSAVLRQRRDFAVRAAAVAGDEEGTGGRLTGVAIENLQIYFVSIASHPSKTAKGGPPAAAGIRYQVLTGMM